MKKKLSGKLSITATISAIFCVFILSVFVGQMSESKSVAFADSGNVAYSVIEEREIALLEMDLLLYNELMFIRDGVYPDAYAENYVKLKTTDFVNLTELNLDDVRDEDLRMGDVSGLGLFDFSNLRVLNLSNNHLTQITANTFAGMTNLDSLDITGNNLTILDFGNLQSIKELKAEKNSLKSVDLSKMTADANIDLSFNEINDITKLNLKADGENASVDLYGNYITNFRASDYQNYNMIVGFQQSLTQYNEKTIINLYKFDDQEFWIECKNKSTLVATDIVSSGSLQPGTYEVRLEDANGYYDYDVIEIVIKKSAPTFIITNKGGEEVDYSQVIKEKIKITFDSNDENYNVEYSINGGDYIKGSVVNLEKTGSYSFVVRSVSENGDISQNYAFTVEMNIYKNMFWQYLAIIFSALAIVGILYLAIMYYNYKANGKGKK